jgi:hypothetical protein
MDLEGVQIKPAEGTIAVKFIDEDDDADDSGALPAVSDTPEPMDYEGCLAIVVAVGPKVAGIKKGDTVVTSEWSRSGMKIGGLTLISSYEVKATLKVP